MTISSISGISGLVFAITFLYVYDKQNVKNIGLRSSAEKLIKCLTFVT